MFNKFKYNLKKMIYKNSSYNNKNNFTINKQKKVL